MTEVTVPVRGLVSAVIAGYNCESFVEPTLRSALDQSHDRMEFLFVDDGSTDGTLGAVKRFEPKVRCVALPHGGVCAARNAGIAAARGQFVAFLDHDDLWAPDKIARQVAMMEAKPDLGLVFTRAKVEGDPSHPPVIPPPGGRWERAFESGVALRDTAGTYLELLCENFIPFSSALVRRSAIPTEGFRAGLRYAEDHDFFLRMSELKRFGFIDATLTTYTIRRGRATERMADLRLEDLEVLDENLARNPWLAQRDAAAIRARRLRLLKEAGWWLLREGRGAEARPLLMQAWKMNPLDVTLPARILASLASAAKTAAPGERAPAP